MPQKHAHPGRTFTEEYVNYFDEKVGSIKDNDVLIDALYREIDDLVYKVEKRSEEGFRFIELMDERQLVAYNQIEAELGPKATLTQWSAAIKKWKEAQP